MNVAFDIFLNDQQLAKEVSKHPDLDTFFGETYDFVKQRLKPLESEINLEEVNNPDKNLVTIIVMNPPAEHPNMRLFFEGYSNELVNRMNGCFSQEDFRYVTQKITHIQSRLNN